MNLLKSALLYSICGIFCYLWSVFFHLQISYLMNAPWIWVFLMFVVQLCLTIVSIGFILWPFSRVASRFFRIGIVQKIVIALLIAAFCCFSGKIAWTQDITYTNREIIIAILQNAFVIIFYTGIYLALLCALPENKKP